MRSYWWVLPGLVVYGIGLAIVLTVNDPVSIDTVPEPDHGQASGVSATAEQGGGAVGIALLSAIFHATYISRLYAEVDARGLPPLTAQTGAELRDALTAAEQVGLHVDTFDPRVAEYIYAARAASDFGYSVTFLLTTALALVGLVATALLVRKPAADDAGTMVGVSELASSPSRHSSAANAADERQRGGRRERACERTIQTQQRSERG